MANDGFWHLWITPGWCSTSQSCVRFGRPWPSENRRAVPRGHLHRATISCPPPSVWGKRDKKGGPARGSKRTFVRFVSAFDPSPAQTCAGFWDETDSARTSGTRALVLPWPACRWEKPTTPPPHGHLAPFPPN